MSNRVGSFIELGMEKEMSKWSRKVKRVLSAVGISVLIAVNAASFSMNASAATIIADSVMIRDDASTDAGIIGSLNEGDEVTIVDQVTDGEGYVWCYVQLENGNYGYVRSDLVSADENELMIGRDQESDDQESTQEQADAADTSVQLEETASETEQIDEAGMWRLAAIFLGLIALSLAMIIIWQGKEKENRGEDECCPNCGAKLKGSHSTQYRYEKLALLGIWALSILLIAAFIYYLIISGNFPGSQAV